MKGYHGRFLEVDLTNKRKDCMNNWDGTTNIKCRHLQPRTQSKNMAPLFKMYFNRQTGMYSVSRPKQEKKAKHAKQEEILRQT